MQQPRSPAGHNYSHILFAFIFLICSNRKTYLMAKKKASYTGKRGLRGAKVRAKQDSGFREGQRTLRTLQ